MQEELLLTFRSPPLPFFIELEHVVYDTGEEYPSRSNVGVFGLLFVNSGTLHIAEGDRKWTLKQGDALVLRPDRKHASFQPCSERTTFDWVQFQTVGAWEETVQQEQATLLGDHYSYVIRMAKNMRLAAINEAKAMFAQLHAAAASSDPSGFWNKQEAFLALLRLLDEQWKSEMAGAAISVAERTAAYLKQHYKQTVTNTVLSHELKRHINYITRCMLEVFDCTPQQYLLFYRLDQAKLLLLRTDWPIAKVAEETGFKQTPHFSRLFTEHTGISPLRYRKRFMNE